MQSYDEYLNFAKQMGIETTSLNEAPAAEEPTASFNPASITIPQPETAELSAKGKPRLAILLHGFNPMGRNPISQEEANNGNYRDYQRFFDAIKAQLPGYSSVVIAYDTHQSFARSGDNLYEFIMQHWADHYDLSSTILVGYSMGGLVARQMVMRGMPFARLYMTCTPNFGVMPYIFSLPGAPFFFHFNHGAASMTGHSADLARLNNGDIQQRQKYVCHGINYTDFRLFHNDDTITDCNHATMVGSNVLHRANTHLGMLHGAVMEPHLRGYVDNPDWGGNWAAADFVRLIRG